MNRPYFGGALWSREANRKSQKLFPFVRMGKHGEWCFTHSPLPKNEKKLNLQTGYIQMR